MKGNRELLECYGRLLERRPDLHGKINLVMTCVQAAAGMRVYRTAQQQIEQLAGKINGRYARLGWTPISPVHSADSLHGLDCLLQGC